jgi:hypothetical protein
VERRPSAKGGRRRATQFPVHCRIRAALVGMSPNPPARRITYVIPPPVQTVLRLLLPRLGADRHGGTTPLLISASPGSDPTMYVTVPDHQYTHPKHWLGISSFALDTSTRLSGKTNLESILYSGERGGQVLAHELGVALKHRSKPYGVNRQWARAGKRSRGGRVLMDTTKMSKTRPAL